VVGDQSISGQVARENGGCGVVESGDQGVLGVLAPHQGTFAPSMSRLLAM
jgi:hypothetical protein